MKVRSYSSDEASKQLILKEFVQNSVENHKDVLEYLVDFSWTNMPLVQIAAAINSLIKDDKNV